MALDYLPLMAQSSAPKPPRVLVSPSKPSWCALRKSVNASRVALLTSAALRLRDQPPFTPREDLSYRLVSSDPAAGDIVIDHHSRIGDVPRLDPEIIFPRSALAALVKNKTVGSVSRYHISFMGGLRSHKAIEQELAPAISGELEKASVDLALLIPY
jgi:D-proline reductase (dithiol) PrdB